MEAIAVNIPRSYPGVVELAQKDPGDRAAHLALLEQVTLGDWARVSERDAEDTQLVFGAYLGQIVSAYRISGYHREGGRIRWTGQPADDFAGLIGQPLPGGDWKRGQARPLRKVTVPQAPGSAESAMVELLRSMARHNHDPERRELCDQLRDQVSVSVQTPSTIVVRVPAGVNVLIHPYPAGV